MMVEGKHAACPWVQLVLPKPALIYEFTMSDKPNDNNQDMQKLLDKIEKEWPIRCKLAELAGHKANPKNIRALMDTAFDLNIRELYLEVLFRKPENADKALELIRNYYK